MSERRRTLLQQVCVAAFVLSLLLGAVMLYMTMDMWTAPLADGSYPPGRGPSTYLAVLAAFVLSGFVAIATFIASLWRTRTNFPSNSKTTP